MIKAKVWDTDRGRVKHGPRGDRLEQAADHYTVIYTRNGYAVFAATMSNDADRPNGVCMSLCPPYNRPTGARVPLDTLPAGVQRQIARHLSELESEYAPARRGAAAQEV